MSLISSLLNSRPKMGLSLTKRISAWRKRCERSLAESVHMAACAALEPRMMMSVTMNFSDTTIGSTDDRLKNMIVCADLDDDGNNDLITAGRDSGNYYNYINIHSGKGNGTFEATSTELAVVGMISSVQAADINGDGVKDLIVTCTGSNYLTVFTGALDEARSYSPGVEYSVGNGPVAVGVGDFNGDGANDLAVVSSTTGMVNILLGNLAPNKAPTGEFTLSTTSYGVGLSPSAIVVADLNKDGVSDLIVANSGSDTISILQGNKTGKKGNGTFSVLADINVGNKPVSLATGDLNNDGYTDVAVCCYDSDEVFMMVNNKKSGLVIGNSYATVDKPTRVVVEDMNGDGIDDVVVYSPTAETVQILQMTPGCSVGSSTMINPDTNDNGETGVDFALTDLNNDGKYDITAISSSNNKTMIRLNTTTETAAYVAEHKPYTYVDSTGDTVTVTLTGPGSLQMKLDSATAASKVSLELFGTTSATMLAFKVTNTDAASPKTTTISSIDLNDGALGKLDAGKVNIADGGSITGTDATTVSIGTILLGDIGNGVNIDLEATVAGGITITAGTAKDSVTVNFGANVVNSATFASFGHSSIVADRVTSLKIAGDLKGRIELAGTLNTKLKTLGTVSVGGNVTEGGFFSITGAVGTMTLGSLFSTNNSNISGSIDALTINDKFTGLSLYAKSINKLTVGGDIGNGSINLVGDSAKNFVALGSLTVDGSINALSFALNVTYGGSIGAIKVSSILNLSINAENSDISSVQVTGKKVKGGTNIEADATGFYVNALSLGSLTVGRNLTSCALTIGVVANNNGTDSAGVKTLKVGGVVTGSLSLHKGNIGTISVGEWTEFFMSAYNGTIGNVTVAGDVDVGSITLTALGSFTVNGSVDGLTLVSLEASLDPAVEIKNITIKENANNFSMSNLYIDVDTLSIGGNWTGSTFNANAIGALKVGGNVDTVSMTLSNSETNAAAVDIKTLAIKGSATKFTLAADIGNAGNLSFGSISNTNIIFNAGNIASLTVAGDADFGYSDGLSYGSIIARSYGTISVGTGKTGGDLSDAHIIIVGDDTKFTDKTVLLKSLKVNGDLNSVSVFPSTLSGTINSITAGSISNGSILSFGAMTVKSVSLIKNAKLGWTGSMTGSQLNGGIINTIAIGGDFDTAIISGGSNGPFADSVLTLGKVTIGGAVIGGTIQTYMGSVGTISAKSMSSGAMYVAASVNKLAIAGNMGGEITNAVSMNIGNKLGTWTVGGNLQGIMLTLGQSGNYLLTDSAGKGNVLLNSLTVGGLMDNTYLTVSGSIGNVSAKRMTYSYIYAGYSTEATGFVGYETIDSIKITGDKNFAASSATANTIYSWKVSAVAIAYPGDNNLADKINALEIGSLKVTRLNGKSNVTKPYSKLDHADVATFSETGITLTLPETISLMN